MTVVSQLKAEAMKLRKARNPTAASITFAISEIEKVGKNAGNRETTEDEAIKVVQKLVATLDSNLETVRGIDTGRTIAFEYEKKILESVLPQMVSQDAVITYLKDYEITDKTTIGELMKVIKAKFGSLVDMKEAKNTASVILAAYESVQ